MNYPDVDIARIIEILGETEMPHVPVQERVFALRTAFAAGLINYSTSAELMAKLANEHYRQLGVHSEAGDD